ncbi:hypothetical protein CEXT_719271 [Caerostris extrusa]|uniref:Uncharacterized protein n=1 Tax=Caerostris extrusa TaxID=172846 RepID=A0AAV4T2T9_CAEEX|nr:hypothetical protein CEXT_719271 [Caerostris extrusa]
MTIQSRNSNKHYHKNTIFRRTPTSAKHVGQQTEYHVGNLQDFSQTETGEKLFASIPDRTVKENEPRSSLLEKMGFGAVLSAQLRFTACNIQF